MTLAHQGAEHSEVDVTAARRASLPIGAFIVLVIAATVIGLALAPEPEGAAGVAVHAMGEGLPWWTLLPFAALLLAIAALPLSAPQWWEHNRNKAALTAALALPVAVYLVLVWREAGIHVLLEKAREYVSFLSLLGSLYVISGGIYLKGSLSGTPLMNTALLGLGTILANLVGTTGASMLLLRPLLRANAARQQKAHVMIFFIFIVSNCAGLLTPLGDPPLFLGFLKGVPFAWTLQQLWKPWLLINGILLVLFHFWDEAVFDREERERPGSQLEQVQVHEPLRVLGLPNLALLGGVMAIAYASGTGLGTNGQAWPFGFQEGGMLILLLASYLLTPRAIHASNRFTFVPITEVAILFAGIFATMAPALSLLNASSKSLGLSEPWHFYWATGLLSSFLDNAPTYLTFSAVASGLSGVPVEGQYLAHLLQNGGGHLLIAIAVGAVSMGANTYIGNGPNFMVKAVAEEAGVKMPSFFGYMLYSLGILLPIFGVVTLLFFLP